MTFHAHDCGNGRPGVTPASRCCALWPALLTPFAPPLCLACRAWAGRAEPLCAPCRASLRRVSSVSPLPCGLAVFAVFAHEGAARALVHALKFRGGVRVAATMAAQIVAGVPQPWLDGAALVPVPAHLSRRRQRGFNQAEVIAAEVAARTGTVVTDCLERHGRSRPQAGLGRAARLAAPAGTVRLRPGALVPERTLLVDDVVTTGATLSACAAALGPGVAGALAYARAGGR